MRHAGIKQSQSIRDDSETITIDSLAVGEHKQPDRSLSCAFLFRADFMMKGQARGF